MPAAIPLFSWQHKRKCLSKLGKPRARSVKSANFKALKGVIANSEGQGISSEVGSGGGGARRGLARTVKLGIRWQQ